MDKIGLDLAGEMLLALTCEEVQNTNQISRCDMVNYILKSSNNIDFDTKKTIGNIIILNNMKNNLISCSEGLVINLDILDNNIIKQIYDFLIYNIANG